ncbi:MAG: hypothetical protein M3N95_17480 [Actinomycetota bacterium]|nr:hypothetical protein [Actinomycetota bacterium]
MITEMVSQIQQMRALLECVWPAALDTAKQPFRSATWRAAMSVIAERDGGDLDRTRRLGADRFEQAVRRQILKQGRQKPCMRIAQPGGATTAGDEIASGSRCRSPTHSSRHRLILTRSQIR